jgi:hypothetical protein
MLLNFERWLTVEFNHMESSCCIILAVQRGNSVVGNSINSTSAQFQNIEISKYTLYARAPIANICAAVPPMVTAAVAPPAKEAGASSRPTVF